MLAASVKISPFFLLIEKLFSKKDHISRNITRNKVGQIRRLNIFLRIYCDLSNSTFNLTTHIIKPNFYTIWLIH